MHKTYTSPGGTRYSLYADMLSRPHLLIAGATGSGKSVVLNGLIYTALLRFPDEVKLILIDLKRVELAEYRNLPHTVCYADSAESAVSALKTAVQICESRYAEMQKQRVKLYQGADLYVVIDEFADLMTTAARRVKPLIQRIGQIGRAAKVHAIVATQTPIAKVLPTEIKCNFDARLGLRTRSAQDSRNIVGYSGLETLPQYGQGVYMTPQGDTLYNIPYITDTERARVVQTWEAQTKKKSIFSFWRA